MPQWLWRIASLVAALAASMAVLSTARLFSATVDEPAHLAAGMQWVSAGEYTYDLQHPPLGRIAIAAGPHYAQAAHSMHRAAVYDEGAAILGEGPHYVETLASARRGVIAFFLLLALATWAWGRRLLGEPGAAIALLLVATNPNVLAHAGLATTDVACAATTMLALFTALWWCDEPSVARTILLGAAIAAAIGSRLSAIAFVGAPLVACYALRGWAEREWTFHMSARRLVGRVTIAIVVALALIVALYRFHPAPFVDGVKTFLLHGGSGHPTFLLGTPSNRGWWYYFPVALLVKTPLPLLALAVVGAFTGLANIRTTRDWRSAAPLVCALVILAISMTVKVDLGVRLVLPVYPLMAVVAAQGIVSMSRQMRTRAAGVGAAALLLASSIVIAVRAHPDYLAYFNLFAGDHPEHVLVDSNLDWGQDLYRLRDTLRARGIEDSVRVAYFGTSSLSAAGVPNARGLGLHERATGWIAASETYLAGEWVGGAYQWLLDYPPVARIGPGMRLWYIEP